MKLPYNFRPMHLTWMIWIFDAPKIAKYNWKVEKTTINMTGMSWHALSQTRRGRRNRHDENSLKRWVSLLTEIFLTNSPKLHVRHVYQLQLERRINITSQENLDLESASQPNRNSTHDPERISNSLISRTLAQYSSRLPPFDSRSACIPQLNWDFATPEPPLCLYSLCSLAESKLPTGLTPRNTKRRY